MASTAKPTGARNNSKQTKKPATIDLKAKEVKAEAKPATATAKAGASSEKTSKSEFDRPGTSAPADKKTQNKEQSGKKPEQASASAKPSASPTPKIPASASSAPAAKSGSFMSNLTSALMGGVAALAGFGVIGLWEGARELPIIGSFYGGTQTDQASTEVAALNARIDELVSQASSQAVDLAPVNEKLNALETSIASISDSTGADEATEKLIELEQNVGAINTTLAKITSAAAQGGNTSSIALSTAIASVTSRLDAMETDLGTLATSVSKNPALTSATKTIVSLETKIADISNSVSGLQKTAETNASGLAELNSQSTDLQNTVASVKASEKIARSVAVNALGTALANDDALALPISSVKALIGETAETVRLEALNDAGIATRKELTAQLDGIINTVQNPLANAEEGSISDRLWANAQNLVSFRSSGPREGDDALAILSRAKASLEKGDLAELKSQWDTLPADIREKGKDWLGRVDTRLEAFAIHEKLTNQLTPKAG